MSRWIGGCDLYDSLAGRLLDLVMNAWMDGFTDKLIFRFY